MVQAGQERIGLLVAKAPPDLILRCRVEPEHARYLPHPRPSCTAAPAVLSVSHRAAWSRGTVGDVSTAESGPDTMTGLVRRHGIRPCSCELAPPGSLISVISAIAPGLERFSLARLGLPVIPTGRGWDMWTRARLKPCTPASIEPFSGSDSTTPGAADGSITRGGALAPIAPAPHQVTGPAAGDRRRARLTYS